MAGVSQDYLHTGTDAPAAVFHRRAGFRPARRNGLMIRARHV
jgi:hypothetical protein